jgi:DNA-binding CsgD family transcriptional regulator
MNQRDLPNNLIFEALARRSGAGMILVDETGEIRWMDDATRRSIDGQLQRLSLPLVRDEHAVQCFLTTVKVMINGEPKELSVVQASPEATPRHQLHSVIDRAVEELTSDCSWLTRALTEKLKAWCQVSQPSGRDAGLDLLTAREREILALICEGRSDPEMSKALQLSQNTVRNHVASLFRKIGVNRRSAAVIWARERGITRHDVLAFGSPKKHNAF